jgi:hypothetical protein
LRKSRASVVMQERIICVDLGVPTVAPNIGWCLTRETMIVQRPVGRVLELGWELGGTPWAFALE